MKTLAIELRKGKRTGVIPVLLAVAAVICFFVARSISKAALTKKERGGKRGCGKSRP